MKVRKIGIFTEEQIRKLSESNDLRCYYSDLARITDGKYDETVGFGDYWVDGMPSQNQPNVRTRKYVSGSGILNIASINDDKKGVRIVIDVNDIDGFDASKIDDIDFEYPLYSINGGVGKAIDKMFESKSKLLYKTGRQHNVDGRLYEEYEVLGIRFIKIPYQGSKKLLSDGTYSAKDTIIYMKVDKIPFVYDEKLGVIYSVAVIFSKKIGQHKKDFFEDTIIYEYLNTDFLTSINDELEHKSLVQVYEEKEVSSSNRYNFDFSTLTEEDIIEICIKSNIAVFLHGKTGTGKTERMLALDKKLELIDFGCTSSDGFTGIIAKDFNSKELFLYEPYWYKSLCKKCEEAPELLHILFLEELTNAKSDVQKVAFEVTLNKTLTNSGFRLELPKNAVVCAAGNEVSESRSANGLSEPLFGRFAHVYIDTDSDEWLDWALRRKKEERKLEYIPLVEHEKIHPAIVDYIKVNGNKVLRTPYNGITPNADPRKWALASKALYECNNPNVLRAFVGDEITKDFIKFSKLQLATIDDVINDRCAPSSVPFDPSIRWYTTLCLSSVDDENFDKVREFVSQLGNEFLAMFDYEWSKGDEQKMMELYKKQQFAYAKKLVPNEHK